MEVFEIVGPAMLRRISLEVRHDDSSPEDPEFIGSGIVSHPVSVGPSTFQRVWRPRSTDEPIGQGQVVALCVDAKLCMMFVKLATQLGSVSKSSSEWQANGPPPAGS
jgi:hypothetical protein